MLSDECLLDEVIVAAEPPEWRQPCAMLSTTAMRPSRVACHNTGRETVLKTNEDGVAACGHAENRKENV